MLTKYTCLVKNCLLGMDILSTCPMTKTAITTLNKVVEESAYEISWTEDSDLTEMSKPILICALGDLEVT